MKSPRLDRLIDVYRPTISVDETGQRAETFEWVDTWHAALAPMAGSEGIVAGQVMSQETDTFIVRHDAAQDARTSWQIAWQGTRYDIVRLKPVGRRQYLEITARQHDESQS